MNLVDAQWARRQHGLPTAFVGLGEGIGNVLMGLPVVDALHRAGWDVVLSLRPTPEAIHDELRDLVFSGRPWLEVITGDFVSRFDLAVLTHWWLSRGGPMPTATETRVGLAPSEDFPEILANLAALEGLVQPDDQWGRVEILLGPRILDDVESEHPAVALHPGCKPDAEWRARKVYARWYEVVHRLKEAGARPWIAGGAADRDLYVGEPWADTRGDMTLLQTARLLSYSDVVLSGDSGIHHLAVALGRPTVALFGQSSAEKARHPNPAGPAPVIIGPFTDPAAFAAVSPRTIARACLRAAQRALVPA